jgi:DNA mismatch endonuclease (patch repair protein)
MTDIYVKEKRSQIMAAIKGRENKATELKAVTLFRRNHISGWRRHLKLPGTPDFAFKRQRLAVFVDGCFWHGCPVHFKLPKSRSAYWAGRIRTNKKRDRRVARQLRAEGWIVVRIWQHDLRKVHVVLARLRRALSAAGLGDGSHPKAVR